jgi:Domain of unknown function (DUF4381)
MSGRRGSLGGACAAAFITAWVGTAPAQAPLAPAAAQLRGVAAEATPASSLPAPTPGSGPTGTPPGPASAPSAAPPTEDIRDIRGPKYIAPAWLWPALIAGAIVLIAGVYGVRRWLRHRRRPRPLLPFEVALQRLEEIRGLMEPASAREFSIAVSDIVRHYIEQRFDVTATHRTTEEFLHDLLDSSHPTLARHRGLLSEFLHQCDLVKFAGMSLSVRGMEALRDSARTFVLETAKPDPPPEAEPLTGQEAHDSLSAT